MQSGLLDSISDFEEGPIAPEERETFSGRRFSGYDPDVGEDREFTATYRFANEEFFERRRSTGDPLYTTKSVSAIGISYKGRDGENFGNVYRK